VKEFGGNSSGIKTHCGLEVTRAAPLERYYLDYTLYNKYYLVFIKGVGN
jgi:hypothetical protein